MTKSKPPVVPKKKAVPQGQQAPPAPRKDGMRETVESVVIAFVLAFLFRAFEAEAFVIPTGSMAPTLMGVHKDLECEVCKLPYRVSASQEQDELAEAYRAQMSDGGRALEDRNRAAAELADRDVIGATCPNCRFRMNIDPQSAEGRKFPTYKGDRILVSKFPYDFSDPQRWDVIVFKYPQGANENYIKRCVGLPNETLEIYGGNIYLLDPDGAERTIVRKPPDKVRAIMQIVYDNDYVVADLVEAGLPPRWQSMTGGGGEAWQPVDGYLAYRTDGSTSGEAWLGYQHRVPNQENWDEYSRTKKFVAPGGDVPPRLISDFYAYNAGRNRNFNNGPLSDALGLHWVGDLILECRMSGEPSGKTGDAYATLRLIRGGQSFDCRIDVVTGKARLSIGGVDTGATADTPIRPGRTHSISFANVDCQLLLWVDGRAIEFDNETTYAPEVPCVPTMDDLTPARIGSNGASVQVDHLRILRDVYYIADRARRGMSQPRISDYEPQAAGFLAKPAAWPRVFANLQPVTFKLDAGQFLMLGDNSPCSADSRFWRSPDGSPEHYVTRDMLVGKAVFVYWPHSWNRIPGTRIWFPMFPNFARMKFVR